MQPLQSAATHLAEARLAAVNPHNAALQALSHTLAALSIGRDHRASQAILAVVGQLQRLSFTAERADCRHAIKQQVGTSVMLPG